MDDGKPVIICPYCKSDNVLPFEEESKGPVNESLFIIIFLALAILGAYFLFVISSYLFFPAVVFAFIILASYFINRQDKKKKKKAVVHVPGEYICLDCSNDFTA